MRRRLFAAAIACALPGAGCATFAAGPPALFEIHNDTSVTAEQLFFRPAGAAGRSEDLLGEAVLAPGRWVEAPLNRADGCRYELRAMMAGGATILAREVDVCAAPRFKLSAGERQRPRVGGARPAAPPPAGRGLPVCPGDPRCKKKK